MQEPVGLILNTLLAERGRLLAPDSADLLDAQRHNFLREFGPDRLATLSGAELLRLLPYNLTNDQPLDYWLEFRNDTVFTQRLFGGIGGGSAAKFGTWQDKRTGRWRAKLPGASTIRDISEHDALAIVLERQQEMLAATRTLANLAGCPLQELDPEAVQAALTAAAPRWKNSAWLHKYLHLNYPELVTWNATLSYLQAALYRLGIPAIGSGLYALDGKSIQFWGNLPALAEMPIAWRYRLLRELPPRDHWCLNLAGDVAAGEAMVTDGVIAFGPAALASLAGAFSLSRQAEVRAGIETACRDAGMTADPKRVRDLLILRQGLKAGSLIVLLSDAVTVTAVGEVHGGYHYAFHAERPHQIPVRWLHQQPFRLSAAVDFSAGALVHLPAHSPAVAAVEASLWQQGILPEVFPPGSQRDQPAAVSLPELPPGLIRQLLAMLERKKQVVLYGPPGTGKTYHAEQAALTMVARYNYQCLPEQLSSTRQTGLPGQSDPYIVTCTFHPLYAYEDFIEGYRPTADGFALKPGLFRRLAAAAQAQPHKRFVLIIDEINRGNIPRIFGELITLLEPSRRGRSQVVLPLSGDTFCVPPNLYIIATMNTADRSILVLDTALRRRFGFMELLPQPQLLQAGRIGDIALSTWLSALNRGIVDHLGRDGRNLQIGHAYFLVEGKPAATLERIAEIVLEDIWPLLQEYCYEDPRALAAILAADRGGIYDRASASLRYELFEPGREQDLLKALAVIVTAEDSEPATAMNRASRETDG